MFSTCVLSVFASIVIIILIYKSLRWISILRKWSRLPGPKGLPILGIALDLAKMSAADTFKAFRQWSTRYGPIFKYSALHIHEVNISGPEEFEAIASKMKNLHKANDYILLQEWLGKGLLTNGGSKWQQRRRIMTPAFHFGILQEFVSVFNSETDRCIEILKREVNKPFTNIIPIMSQLTLYTIAESSFGTKLDENNKSHKEYVSATQDIGEIIMYRAFRPWYRYSFIFHAFSSLSNKYKQSLAVLHRFTENIIKERAKNFQTFETTTEESHQRKKLAFLDLLLNAKLSKGLIDDKGIKDEVNTFMFEGHDTTSIAICCILLLLAEHPEYQDLIYDEITNAIDSNRQPELQDLNKLDIMDRFIKESLRLYPSVTIIGRMLDQDILLSGYELPQEMQINIHIYDIHRSPKHWPEPEKFDPDRFLPDNCINRHPFAYVPFSAGPRNCIGQKFAMLELKAMLCGILKNFKLESVQSIKDIEFDIDIVLRPTDKCMKIKFVPRKIV